MSNWTPKLPKAALTPFEQSRLEVSNVEIKKPDAEASTLTVDMIRTFARDLYKDLDKDLYRDSQRYFWGSDFQSAQKPRQPDDYAYREAREKVQKFLHKASANSTGWSDVVGNEAARTALLEAIEHPVKHKDLYRHYGMRAPRGVLLYGPPGCGKTMLAKASAAALARLYGKDAELVIINGAELQSMWVGETEKTIRQVFAFAREYRKKHGHPLVIFIDEADAMLPSRDRSYRREASNVATFLTEMDGMEESGAFVMLATNRPDTIDEAVLRDGRIDRRVKVERPTLDAALAIAAAQMTGPWCSASPSDLCEYLFDPTHMVRNMVNPESGTNHHFTLAHLVSGAMIVALVERAKGIAMRRDLADGTQLGVTPLDLRTAVDAVLMESKGLNHDYALREFVETVAIPFEEARTARVLN